MLWRQWPLWILLVFGPHSWYFQFVKISSILCQIHTKTQKSPSTINNLHSEETWLFQMNKTSHFISCRRIWQLAHRCQAGNPTVVATWPIRYQWRQIGHSILLHNPLKTFTYISITPCKGGRASITFTQQPIEETLVPSSVYLSLLTEMKLWFHFNQIQFWIGRISLRIMLS